MTDDNLGEFLNERVLATRQCHHIDFPVDLDAPAVAVMLDCSQDGMAVVVLPVFIRGTMHLELHFFADGERADPDISVPIPSDGVVELTLRKGVV